MRKHRNHTVTKVRRLSLCALGALAAAAPTASADTTAPVFSCRGSAGYLEVGPLPRVEPVTANADAPSTTNPDGDRAQCASDRGGLPFVVLPPGASSGLQLTLRALAAETSITPELGPARTQTATSRASTALDPLMIDLGAQQLVIRAEALTSSATATCVNGAPVLTGTSQVVRLTINGTVIDIPTGQDNVVVDQLQPLLRIVANEQVTTTNPTTGDRALVRRALHIQVLQTPGGAPAANIVLAESKVDTHGAVCAPPPPPPPPPACPAGSVAQPGSSPLVCLLTQTAPCPAGSTPDPNAGGACIVVREAPATPCPRGSIDDPRSNNCVFIVERPCPSGAKPDPKTRVCVVNSNGNGGNTSGSGNGTNGSNGGIGRADGPRVTCGRISMRFVRNGKQTLSNRFGRRLVTRGRLVTCGSNPRPIVGARITVVHVLPGGKRFTKTGLRSRPGGKLTLILPLNLRSRRIEYSYRPDLTRDRVSSRSNLRLTVRSNRTGRVLR